MYGGVPFGLSEYISQTMPLPLLSVLQKAFHNCAYEMEVCPLMMLCKATFNWSPVKPLAEL